ncbi:MAG: hypothetical protein IJP44_03600 [Bacteroidales bacterium]|nr:hypothetical protein [Bacteroidales bacterium]
MKSRNIFLGIVFLAVGVVSLLASIDVIDFSWRVAWRLWPMLLIFVGIAILPLKDWLKALLMVVALAVGVWLYQGEARKEAERRHSGWSTSVRQWWDELDDDVFDLF